MHLGRGFNEVKIGDHFENVMTMTETHLVLGAGLFGDFNPLHIDESFSARSRYGGRIAHGYLTSSFMASALGMLFHGTAIAYLEHCCRFTAPVRAGDTLTAQWTVTGKEAKTLHHGGIVSLAGKCFNQEKTIVAEATAKMLVQDNPA